MHVIKKIVFVAILIVATILSSKVHATTDPPVVKRLSGSTGQLHVDSFATVTDNKFHPLYSNVDTPYAVHNTITFKLDEGADAYISYSFTAVLDLKIIYRRTLSSTWDSITRTFNVSYSPFGGTSFQPRDYYVFKGAREVKIKVVDINATDSVGSDVTSNVLPLLIAENEMQIQPQYKFNCHTSIEGPISSSASLDELSVSWSQVTGADEYDLEWAYIDSAAINNFKIGSDWDTAKIFLNNAARVSVDSISYAIPLMYDNAGILFYRVRAVQYTIANKRYEADWSRGPGFGKYSYRGHERGLNWQSTISYAEEGKRKVVVQYYDGSLRGRQTVTKDNSTNTVIAAESFYDYQGRPVIQVLPAPTFTNVIKYTQNFNIGLNGSEYEKNNYDSIGSAAAYKNAAASGFKNTSGASRYYSANNPNVSSGEDRFIPAAENYPFTETEYKQDGTGRINKQSGVGLTHKLGSTHETQYFYGTPEQEELDALFGTEVGDRSHYFKNMVKDANGQYSVSYVDMHGRTITTALASQPDSANLETLSSSDPRTITEKLIDSNTAVIRDLTIQNTRSLLVSSKGNHQFNYSLTPQSLTMPGCTQSTVCYDCLYDLRITITDDCNNQNMPQKKAFDTLFTNVSVTPDTSCTAAPSISKTFTLNLDKGNYEITKKLTVSRKSMDYYRESVFMKKNACKSLQTFIDSQRALVYRQLECIPSCQACRDSLGTWDSFRIKFMNQAGITSPVDTAANRGLAWAAYNDAAEGCQILCDSVSESDDIRKVMLQDMTPPMGQYADINRTESQYSIFFSMDGDNYDPEGDSVRTSKYQEDTIRYTDGEGHVDYVMDDNTGLMVQPNYLDSAMFTSKFKTVWADSLLKLHPEYCKLIEYERFKDSHYWDRKFEKVETFKEARNAGYLNPTKRTTGHPFTLFPYSSTNYDPLSNNATAKGLLEAKLEKYAPQTILISFFPRKVSLWMIANMMVKGSAIPITDNTELSHLYNNPFDTTTMCEGDLDMAWRNFKMLYLLIKRDIVNDLINVPCPSPTAQQLVDSGYTPRFNSTIASVLQYGLDTSITSTIPYTVQSPYRDRLDSMYTANCKSNVELWKNQVGSCYPGHTFENVVVPQLLRVCKLGADENHYNGSSTINPDSSSFATFKSFEEVLDYYNNYYGITTSLTCNSNMITYPPPFDQGVSYSDIEAWTKPTECECKTINEQYRRYRFSSYHYSDFANYMQVVKHTTMTNADLMQLVAMCNNDTASCRFLAKPIMIPPALQCAKADICISCEKMNDVYKQFKTKYPFYYPKPTPANSFEEGMNTIFEKFVSNKTGITKTSAEYLAFMRGCKIDLPFIDTVFHDPALCDEFYNDVTAFLDYYNHLPTPALPIPGQYLQWFHTKYPYTNVTNFEDIVALYLSLGCDYPPPYSAYSAILDAAGEGYTHMTDCDHLSGEFRDKFEEFYGSLPDPKLPRPGIFVQYFNYYFGVNYNYLQIDSVTTTNCGQNVWDMYEGVGLPDIDGCEVLQVVLDEFGIYYAMLQEMNAEKPELVPLCTKAFEDYFNSYFGTNYNYPQIDSIFISWGCERLRPCGGVELNGDLECHYNPIMIQFQEWYSDLTYPRPSKNEAFITFLATHTFGAMTVPPMTYDNFVYWVKMICPEADSSTYHYPPNEPDNGDAYRLCGSPKPIFADVVDDVTNCSDSSFFIQSAAIELYNLYVDSLKNSFDKAYMEKCLQAYKYESFTVTHAVDEYHYTLYYYDQAGNLVKTVPPKGVNPNRGTTWLANVKTARQNKTRLVPAHTMTTRYVYNTLNQVVAQKTPDAGGSNFWYDRLGRLAVSRNSKQTVEDTYSYTLYDSIGRINEVGKVENPQEPMTDAISRRPDLLLQWIEDAYRKEVTKTVYDVPETAISPQLNAKNLRNRVSYTAVYHDQSQMGTHDYRAATFYSYDIHGNVDTLVQDFKQGFMNDRYNRFKKIEYGYDLVSGKVNSVAYQRNRLDQFFHRYEYDAENRLTNVFTSKDSLYWEKDAYYKYYRHGPLARTVLGQQQVQGLDYAYTLQGWLKGINGTDISHISHGDIAITDMGMDGDKTSNNSLVARDAFGFGLYYYGRRDYQPIAAGVNRFAHVDEDNVPEGRFKPLFNGNIAAMHVNIPVVGEPILNAYTYDQLNRLILMQPHKGFAIGTNEWSGIGPTDSYRETIVYDANGNIEHYTRKGSDAINVNMDELTYHYTDGSSNRLSHISDEVGDGNYDMDIDMQDEGNYQYDSIGNLTSDAKEGIDNISWTVYGKIASITKSNGNIIDYTYDASGNRISKTFTIDKDNVVTTWYVRDAQGNVLSVYKRSKGEPKAEPSGPKDEPPPVDHDAEPNDDILRQAEVHLYGSSRLAVTNTNVDVNEGDEVTDNGTTMPGLATTGKSYIFTRGKKFFELSNHLGNVLVTISDRKLVVPTGDKDDFVGYYNADVINANDYYPFGMVMPGRSFSNGGRYRYGFNGQEKSDEIKGKGNSYTAEYWEYDPRSGRRWNVDPKPLIGASPYSTFKNNPLFFKDPYGDTAIFNNKGIVIRNDKNGDGVVFYQYDVLESGKKVSKLERFYLNDKKMDAAQIDKFDVGKQMVRFLNEDNTNWILNKSGADDGVLSSVPGINHAQAIAESHLGMDYGHNFLRPNIVGKDGAEGVDMADDYSIWDNNGGFIYFIGSNYDYHLPRLYNVPDAGNFLFGTAVSRMNIGYLDLVMGSQANELIKGRNLDAGSDQAAIKQGYLYDGHLQTLKNPIIRWFTGYDQQRPSWFDPKNDGNIIFRR